MLIMQGASSTDTLRILSQLYVLLMALENDDGKEHKKNSTDNC